MPQANEQFGKRIHKTQGEAVTYHWFGSQSPFWSSKSISVGPPEHETLVGARWLSQLSPEDTLPINRVILDAIVEYQITRSLERHIHAVYDLTGRVSHIEKAIKRLAHELRSLRADIGAICDATGVEQHRAKDLELAHTAREIANSFSKLLVPLPQAEAVFVTPENGGFAVTTVVDDIDKQTANRIYALELKLAMLYPDVSFDFRIFRRQGRDLQSLMNIRSSDVLVPIQV